MVRSGWRRSLSSAGTSISPSKYGPNSLLSVLDRHKVSWACGNDDALFSVWKWSPRDLDQQLNRANHLGLFWGGLEPVLALDFRLSIHANVVIDRDLRRHRPKRLKVALDVLDRRGCTDLPEYHVLDQDRCAVWRIDALIANEPLQRDFLPTGSFNHLACQNDDIA